MPTLIEELGISSEHPSKLWFHKDGNWSFICLGEIYSRALALSYALHQNGLRKGDALGILAPSGPEWLCMDLACQLIGLISVPLFEQVCPDSFHEQVKCAELKALYVNNPNHCPQLIEHLTNVPMLISNSKDRAFDFEQLCSFSPPKDWEYNCRTQSNSHECSTLIFTSGSMGEAKGVMLSTQNFIYQVEQLCRLFPIQKGMRALSVLPLQHVLERTVCYVLIKQGADLYFADDPKKTGQYLHEIKAEICTLVPRILEKIHQKLEERALLSQGFRGLLMRAALGFAKTSPLQRNHLQRKFWDLLFYRHVRAKLGNSLKYILVGGASFDTQLNLLLCNLGLPIYEGYGLSECSPVLSVNSPKMYRLGSQGKALEGVQLKISEDGELLCQSPGLMLGYKNQNKHLNQEGFFPTGDMAYIDTDGFVYLQGRKKELFKTSSGKYVAPVYIEQQICFHIPLIECAIIVAEQKPFVSALLFVPQEFCHDSLQSIKMKDQIARKIRILNEKLNPWDRVRKWELLPVDWIADQEYWSAKSSPKRILIYQKFAAQIQHFYQ